MRARRARWACTQLIFFSRKTAYRHTRKKAYCLLPKDVNLPRAPVGLNIGRTVHYESKINIPLNVAFGWGRGGAQKLLQQLTDDFLVNMFNRIKLRIQGLDKVRSPLLT